jgi:pimeloyl-ACP methyl ester carboxylesterase
MTDRYYDVGRGRPIVLIHAFPLSADQWRPLLDAPPEGVRLIAPHLRGFRGLAEAGVEWSGRSLDRPALAVTMADYAADVLSLMDHLEIPDATVCGVSMGGYVAFAILRQAPERVSALMLAHTRATADTPASRDGRDRMTALARAEGPVAIAREMVPKLLGATTQREQPDEVARVRALIEANTTEAIVAALGALKTRPDSTPLLASIRCPTTIVHGDEDTIIPLADAEAMHHGIQGSQLIRVPRAGHLEGVARVFHSFVL